MTNYPREPHAGDKVSAQLLREIIRCLRRITPKAGSGTRLRETPDGTFIDAGAGTSSTEYKDKSCWRIVKEPASQGSDTMVLRIKYMFYMIGGRMYQHTEDVDLYDYINQGELAPGQEYTGEDKPVIYFRVCVDKDGEYEVGDGEICAVQDTSEMEDATKDVKWYVRPLYILTHSGGINVDFRNMPELSAMEIP